MVRDELKRNPTLLGLDKLLEARLLDMAGERRADLELVKRSDSSAYARAGDVSLQALRFQGAPILLALPGLSQLGKLFAET